ncbi:MAG: DUF4058 family protein [Cyanobacteria bacterium J06639_14]
MPSPFPGMNPYLEHPDRWSTVHNRLIVALADVLTPQLVPKYQVDIEKRIYEVIGANSLLVGRPDITVQRPRVPDSGTPIAVALSTPAPEPVKVQIPMLEEVREAYLEVKEAATQEVITAIEIISPSNKHGNGRQKYEQKRQQILSSRTHLVEIDLLRAGAPLPTLGKPLKSHYRLLVSRSEVRPTADLYLFNMTDPIPAFRLPLQTNDKEPIVQLQDLLNDVYKRSGYNYFIDYTADPLPPLSGDERDWIDAALREQNLR